MTNFDFPFNLHSQKLFSQRLLSQKLFFERLLCVAFVIFLIGISFENAFAQSPAAGLIKRIKEGRVPANRMSRIVEVICDRGDASDLAFVFDKITSGEFKKESKTTALEGLIKAAKERKVIPEFDAKELAKILKSSDETTLRRGLELIGVWKAKQLDEAVVTILKRSKSAKIQTISLQTLVGIGSERSINALKEIAENGTSISLRFRAAGSLVRFKAKDAARFGAATLKKSTEKDDPGLLLQPFFNQKGASKILAQAIEKISPSKDVAKMALRYMYSVGRSDEELSNALSNAAQIEVDVKPLTKAEMKKLIADVQSKGDPERGEDVFRRKDISCMKCHAISGAGGNVGPDLSPIGQSSPVDYLINAIMIPDQDIKEVYKTLNVETIDGLQIQGIVVDKNDDRIVLREASGKQHSIPLDDIDDEFEGGSLMPKGLTGFLTRQELVDLVSFLSKLGKPGKYAVRTKKTVQRWQYYFPESKELIDEVPSESTISTQLLERDNIDWVSVYGKVVGALPLDEIIRGEKKIVYLRGNIKVTAGGEVELKLQNAKGINAWIDDSKIEDLTTIRENLTAGDHQLTLRLDFEKLETTSIVAEFKRPADSDIEFVVVGGN